MKRLFFVFCVLFVPLGFGAEISGVPFLTGAGTRVSSSTNPLLTNIYPPRTAAFSESVREAKSFSNQDWKQLSILERAHYLHDVYEALVEAHGYNYSPRILICKSYLESTFEPQIKNSGSSASGLAQVVIGTTRDTLSRGRWRSVVPGFEDISSGDTYHERMKGNMIAQMDLGLGVLKQKQRDTGKSDIKDILAAYYGSKSTKANQAYAKKIDDCAVCIEDAKKITEACLNIVKG